MSVAEDEDTSSISSSSEDDVNAPPLKKTKRSRDGGDSEVDASSRPHDPYERLHHQMITAASQLKKLKEQCELYVHVTCYGSILAVYWKNKNFMRPKFVFPDIHQIVF